MRRTSNNYYQNSPNNKIVPAYRNSDSDNDDSEEDRELTREEALLEEVREDAQRLAEEIGNIVILQKQICREKADGENVADDQRRLNLAVSRIKNAVRRLPDRVIDISLKPQKG